MAAINNPASSNRTGITPYPAADATIDDEFGDLAVPSIGTRPSYEVQQPLQPISGFTNYTPQEMRVMALWLQTLPEICQLYGFTQIVNRPVEFAANLQKKGGLDKQMYGISRLQDGSLTKLGLPFDRTVPLAIFIATHSNEITFPYSRFDIGYAFRGEKASQGRYRAFYQADIDTIDRNLSIRADAQCIVALLKGVESLGVKNYRLFLNHIVIAKWLIQTAGISQEDTPQVLRIIDKLKPDNREEVVAELCTVLTNFTADQAEKLIDTMAYSGPIEDFQLTDEVPDEVRDAYKDLCFIKSTAEHMGIDPKRIHFSSNLVRGLDYYTGVLFETFIVGKEKFGSIASGGRYSDLVDGFSTTQTGLEGVGGSIGLTRLFDVMKAENMVDLTKQTTAQVMVGYRTMNEYPKALQVAQALRNLGIYVETYVADRIGIKKELNYCNKKGIPFAALVMSNESIVLKDLGHQVQDEFHSIEKLIEVVAKMKEDGVFSKETYAEDNDHKSNE